MKNILLIFLLTGACLYARAQGIPQAKTLAKQTPIKPLAHQPDSLDELRASIHGIIQPFIAANNSKPLISFSICVITDEKGNFDTLLVSDNIKGEFRYQLSKASDKLATRELNLRARAKGWYNTHIIFPVTYLYPQHPDFNALWDNYQENLMHTLSFNTLKFSVTAKQVVMANPIGGYFSVVR